MIDSGCKWRTKANRQKATELKEKEQPFTNVEQALIDVDVNEEDSIKLTQSSKTLNCISACRKVHNGPITTIEKPDSLVQDKKRHDEALHKSLNLEIKLRKHLHMLQSHAPCFNNRS